MSRFKTAQVFCIICVAAMIDTVTEELHKLYHFSGSSQEDHGIESPRPRWIASVSSKNK
jgi:hypothetical protein